MSTPQSDLLGSRTVIDSSGVRITYLPPGPESPALRFQMYQFDHNLGSTVSRSLTPEASRLVNRDPTLGAEMHDMLEVAKRKLREVEDVNATY